VRKKRLSRSILRFVVVFAACLAVLAALWPRVTPLYTSAVATIARPLFRLVETPNMTVLDVRGDELGIYRIVGEGQITPIVLFDRYLFFAVVPLIALFAATPALGLRRRMTRTALGLVGLFALHVAYLVASVELIYAFASGHAVEGLQISVRILWESAPVLIWATLTTGAWKRVLEDHRAEAMKRTGSPSAGPIGAEG